MSTETDILDAIVSSYASASEAIAALSTMFTEVSEIEDITLVEDVEYEVIPESSLDVMDTIDSIFQAPNEEVFNNPLSMKNIVPPSFPPAPYYLPGGAVYKDLPDIKIDLSVITNYSSSLFTKLKTTLESRISDGGTIWPESVKSDAYDVTREQDLLDLEDAKNKFLNEWTKRGFPKINGILVDGLNQVETEYLKMRQTKSKELSFKMMDLEQSNVADAIKSAISLEMQSMNFHLKYQALLLRATEDLQKAHIDIYRLWTELYKAHNLDINTYYMVLLDEYKIKNKIDQAILDRYILELEALRKIMEAEMKKAMVILEKYRLDVENFAISIDGIVAVRDVKSANLAAEHEINVGKYKVDVKNKEVVQRVKVATADLKSSIDEAIAHLRSQVGGATLAVKGHSVTRSKSKSTDESATEAVYGSHNYEV